MKIPENKVKKSKNLSDYEVETPHGTVYLKKEDCKKVKGGYRISKEFHYFWEI